VSVDVDFPGVPIPFPYQTRNRSFIIGRYQFVIGRCSRAQLLVEVRLIEFETAEIRDMQNFYLKTTSLRHLSIVQIDTNAQKRGCLAA
jgi:hypothetical protein